jgi:hypothetical protein
VRRTELIIIDADVSTSRNTGVCFGDSYSLTKCLPVRAVILQSMARTGSPGW